MKNILKDIFRDILLKYLENRELTVCQTVSLKKWKFNSKTVYGDYVRNSILELISEEIYSRNVSGSVAEVGIYRGGFTRYINKLFYDRTLYLFDTFVGFDKRDLEIEYKNRYSNNKPGHLEDTSIENVKSLLLYPENCIFKIGYFPETAKGVTESFVFVSIDVDLYKPTLSALEYFYPLLSKPGYIFVHDYGIEKFKGATEAVNEFCNNNEITLLPLSDSGGTAVILK